MKLSVLKILTALYKLGTHYYIPHYFGKIIEMLSRILILN
ncbi:hypothetical protein Runsl_3767 [Runella slithyformis DSM 19594]|uniref:Uncharacterized protein n=1 Tax=Runella slithyformis (strain ATCC 29530 / DSM 19594 / LMG 11500 / NCIMB 11436 / LSU 4) TaxID=761193 RepID=A0A7U3ZMU7_RUNSL|nr:hypothetical protein Runsl_3767 [Runella slithyformis DSM 19594]